MTGQDGNRSRGGFRVNPLFLLVGLLALTAAHGLALLFRIAPAVSLWFPPSGVAIALTFWLGPIGAGLTGLASVIMAPAWGSQGWLRLVGLTDAVEPLLAWLLYCRFFGGSLNLAGLPQVIAFLLSAPLAACAASALLGCSILSRLGNLDTVDLGTTIAHWWLGNALGTLTLTPLALLLLIPRLTRGKHSPLPPESGISDWLALRRHWLETLVILTSAIGASFLTVKATETSVFVTLQLSLLGLVPLVWAAIRFGLPGAVLALSFRVSTALLAYLVVYPNAMALPSFPVAPELLHTHKLSLLLQSAIALLVGAAISERTAVQVALTAEQIRRSEYQARAEMGEQLFQLNRQLNETNAHLQQTESVLNAFLTSSPVGLALLDPNLRYLYANEALAKISGAPLDQHLGRSLADVAPPLAARLGSVLQAVLASRQPILNLEFDDGLDGTHSAPLHRHALANAFPVSLPNGDVLGVGMTILDISELKRIEAALRQSELNFRTLADAVPQMFWITGADGYHQYFNQRWYDYTGTTLEQTRGDGWQRVLHPDDVLPTQRTWQYCLQTGTHYEVEYRLRQAADGTYRWHLGRALPLRDQSNQITQWFGSCTDIHDQKLAIEERAQALERERAARLELEQAGRMKDEFLAIVSHELRSPLNAILGWSRLLRDRKLSAEKTDQALASIERNAQAQTQLIEDLLDISRIVRGKVRLNLKPVDLSTVIEAAIDTVQPTASTKSIVLETRLEPDIGLVSGDPERLQQIVWNLLSNAIKFTPAGGRVEVRLAPTEHAGAPALGSVAVGEGETPPAPSLSYIRIIVRDTGKGIDPDFLPHVFDRFRQADPTSTRSQGGLGLGLAIVRNLVELHGGTAWADSPGVGQGAIFTVELPRLGNLLPPKPTAAPAKASQDSSLMGLRVLVVDDEADTREFLVATLEEFGAIAIAVPSAAEALAQLQQDRPDVLISDIGMPGEDGYTLIRKIRALPPQLGGQIPAAALTAYVRGNDQQQALAAGFQRHIAKPVEPLVLVRIIDQLARSSPSSSSA